MKNLSLTEQIKESAKNASFTHIGIARAETYEQDNMHLSSWLNNGYHGQMDWIKNRFRIALVFPNITFGR